MIGWSRRDLIWAGVKWALTGHLLLFWLFWRRGRVADRSSTVVPGQIRRKPASDPASRFLIGLAGRPMMPLGSAAAEPSAAEDQLGVDLAKSIPGMPSERRNSSGGD
jgi:hypothetical protein